MKTLMKKKYVLTILAILATLILVFTQTEKQLTVGEPDKCYKSFQDFAYEIPDKQVQQEKFLPLAPWEIESSLPRLTEEWNNYDIKTTRFTDGYIEIWAKSHIPCLNCYHESDAENYNFIIYRTDTKTWRLIPAEVGKSKVFIRDIFVLKDGSVWGSNVWDNNSDVGTPSVLSKFNEQKGEFEFAEETKSISSFLIISPTEQNTTALIGWPKVILDSNGLFWVFLEDTAIYSYNTTTKEIKQHIELPPLSVWDVVSTPSGRFYLRLESRYSMAFTLENNELYEYIPETEKLKPVKIPLLPWRGFSQMILDSKGRLWTNAEGYQNSNGNWKRLHPWSMHSYTNLLTDGGYQWYDEPDVMMESSDGRIWFVIPDSDFSFHKQGIAWLNPDTGDGCWFTSEGNNVVEDSEGNLWLIAGGNLYRDSIEP
jgi:hypothetical protein